VEWPLSVVVSKKALTKYQLMFRHLFFVKHVERQLLATWQDHQVTDLFKNLKFLFFFEEHLIVLYVQSVLDCVTSMIADVTSSVVVMLSRRK
jgi:hypothetical protein